MKMKTKKICMIFLIFLCAATFLLALSFLKIGSSTADAYSSVPVTVNTLESEIKDLFTDYTRTKLNEKYDTMEELNALKGKVSSSMASENFARAEKIIKGEIAFEKGREFSTKQGAAQKIEQFGNVSNYSESSLKFHYCSSDLMLTGIYALSGEDLNVFVEADVGARLPSLIVTQNHGFWSSYRTSVSLNRGMNTFSFPYLSNGVSSSELKGGAVYISNPYLPSEQGGDVSVYIEGGGFYPVFKKGDDENKFLGTLQEYETQRKSAGTKMPDMADLETDNALFSIPSSTLYEVYITKKEITPQKNLELWAEYFHKTFEFNGIPLTNASEYKEYYDTRNNHLKINLRYMTEYPNSGAYATDYHIGIYRQLEWLANYNHIKLHSEDYRYTFDIGHEIGHVLDISTRLLNETTNNVNAANAYLGILGKQATSSLQPYEKIMTHLGSEYKTDNDAFDDGRVLYTSGSYDHNYLVWWCLESVSPGYWGKLCNYYRFDNTFYGSALEKMVYYSSLILGQDLSDYFSRWKVYLSSTRFDKDSASSTLKTALQNAKNNGKIASGDAPHYWFADAGEFPFMQKHKGKDHDYNGDTPTITKITKDGQERTILIGGQPDSDLLGYEVLSKVGSAEYKIAGFTYTSAFVDKNVYASDPSYKIVAVNRYFKTKEGDEKQGTDAGSESAAKSGACKLNGTFYSDLSSAMKAAQSGNTIELLSDCSLQGYQLYKNLTLEVSSDVHKDITISCPGGTFMMQINAKLNLKGRSDAKIVITSGAQPSTNALFYASSGSVDAEYVIFRECRSNMLSGAIYSIGADLNLKNCEFEDCSSSGMSDAIYMMNAHKLTLDNCTFQGQSTDLYFSGTPNLSLAGSIPEMTIGFNGLKTNCTVETNGISLSNEDLSKLHFTQSSYGAMIKDGKLIIGEVSYKLTFKNGSQKDTIEFKSSTFTFGQEELNTLGKDNYCTSYQCGETSYHRGETIALTGDMEFEVKTAEKTSLTLRFRNGKSEVHRFVGEAGFYLPRYDGGERIVLWESSRGSFYAGEIYKSDQSETLTAVYLGYFRYEYLSKGESKGFGYAKYGEKITAIENTESEFEGWFTQGKIVKKGESVEITKDTTLTAIFKGQTFDLSKATLSVSDCVYNGKEQRPKVVVEVDGQTLSEDFYTIEYKNNVNAGTATVVITAKGNLATGKQETNFKIEKATLSTRPSDIIRVGSSAKTLSDVKLPAGWHWETANAALKVGENEFYAVYQDEDNYQNVRALVKVIKSDSASSGSQEESQGGSQGGSQEGSQGGSQGGNQNQGGSQGGQGDDPEGGGSQDLNGEGEEQEPGEEDEGESGGNLPEEIPEGELPEKNPEGEKDPDRDLGEEEKPDEEEDKRDEENRDEASSKEPERDEGNIGSGGQSAGGAGGQGGSGGGQGGLDGGKKENNLLWLLLIPAIVIPAAGVVCFILIKKKRKNG